MYRGADLGLDAHYLVKYAHFLTKEAYLPALPMLFLLNTV